MTRLRREPNIIATVFMWSITTLILASLLLARFSQKAPAAIRVLLLACYRGRRQRPDNWRQRQKGCRQASRLCWTFLLKRKHTGWRVVVVKGGSESGDGLVRSQC